MISSFCRMISICRSASAMCSFALRPSSYIANFRDYWTKDPRGLAKWANHAHPWTALYNHLRKFLGDERAKRVASEWYHLVKGHWPAEKAGK
jgi:hypothetical protein